MNDIDSGQTELERRAQAAFTASVEALDAQTRSQLNRARQAALAELERRERTPWRTWLPVGALAAVAAIALVVWQRPDDGTAPVLELALNPDIAAELGAAKQPGQVLVAFAAETTGANEARANAREKMRRKRADLIVLNQVGAGKAFGTDDNTVLVFDTDDMVTVIDAAPKEDVADEIWDLVQRRLP